MNDANKAELEQYIKRVEGYTDLDQQGKQKLIEMKKRSLERSLEFAKKSLEQVRREEEQRKERNGGDDDCCPICRELFPRTTFVPPDKWPEVKRRIQEDIEKYGHSRKLQEYLDEIK